MSDEKPTCATCICIEPGKPNPQNITQKQYFCHRYPPTNIVVPAPGPANQMMYAVHTSFPIVTLDTWCAEWSDDTEYDDGGEVTEIPENEPLEIPEKVKKAN
jgi:hypothetical protein